MSVRRRTWITRKGEPKEAWLADYVDQHGKRHIKTFKRKKDAATYLVTTLDGYDYWSNATSVQDADGTFTCMTFDGVRNVVTQAREAMAGSGLS